MEVDAREGFELADQVQQLVDREESDVVGFRDTLVDYLHARVETDRQWGYVSSLRSWLDGSPTAPQGFCALEPMDQRKLLAGALNELLQSDEVAEFRSSRGKVGDISTLRSKVEYLLRRSTNGDEKQGPKKERRTDRDRAIAHQGEFPEPERHAP